MERERERQKWYCLLNTRSGYFHINRRLLREREREREKDGERWRETERERDREM